MYLSKYAHGYIVLALLFPESKVHGANMEPIWGRLDPGGPHVGPMNFALWVVILTVGVIVELYDHIIEAPLAILLT